jgi:hypothetical protein
MDLEALIVMTKKEYEKIYRMHNRAKESARVAKWRAENHDRSKEIDRNSKRKMRAQAKK